MILRNATQSDLDYIAGNNISDGLKEHPADINVLVTIEDAGRVMAVGGLKMMNPTSAWCWINLTPQAVESIHSVYRMIGDWINKIIEDKGLIRVMAAIDPKREDCIRLCEHLGFEKESIMLDFFGRQPALMYVRIRSK